MKTIPILSVVAWLAADIYLWLSTDIDPECSKIDGPSIWFALYLQALWIFLVLKPVYLADTLSVALVSRFSKKSSHESRYWRGFLMFGALLIVAVVSCYLFWEGLRGVAMSGDDYRCVLVR